MSRGAATDGTSTDGVQSWTTATDKLEDPSVSAFRGDDYHHKYLCRCRAQSSSSPSTKLQTFHFSRFRRNGIDIDRCVYDSERLIRSYPTSLHLEPFIRQKKTCLLILNRQPSDTMMTRRKRPSLHASSRPTFRMPTWWAEFIKTRNTACISDESKSDSK